MDGLTAQARLKGNHPDLPVVMISGHGTIETAVSAIQQGAYDFIEKPLSLEKVVIVAARALEAGSLRRENQVLRTVLPCLLYTSSSCRFHQGRTTGCWTWRV